MFFKKTKKKKLDTYDLRWKLFLLRDGLQRERKILDYMSRQFSVEDITQHTKNTYTFFIEQLDKLEEELSDVV